MDDWRQKIQRSLRDSHLFLAVLSPSYLASPYCRWEWEDYVRYEAMRQCLGEGVAPVFFITLPDVSDPLTDREIARWPRGDLPASDLRPESLLGQAVAESVTRGHSRASGHRQTRVARSRGEGPAASPRQGDP